MDQQPMPDMQQGMPLAPPGMPPMQQMQNMQQGAQQAPPSGQTNPNQELILAIADLDRRLRVIEERYSTLRKKMQLTDQNLLDSERTFGKDVHTVNEDILNIKRQLHDFTDKILMFGSELEGTAKKTDLKVIEKYLALWSPTTFVTRSEVKDYLKSKQQQQTKEDAQQG